MRQWFGKRDRPTTVTIPVRSKVDAVLVVYFTPGGGAAPGPDLLGGIATAWTEAHLQPPLKAAVAEFQGRGLVSMHVQPADRLPALPVSLPGG